MVANQIKDIYRDSRGGILVYLIIVIIFFIGISGLVLDFSNVYTQSKKIKYAVNKSAKASSLQILTGDDLANGYFKIDETKAEDVFRVILAHNLGLDESTLEPLEKSLLRKKPVIKEFAVENNTPTTYHSQAIGQSYVIDNPSVIVVLEFEIRGVFIKKTLRVGKLSSSQVTSVYP